ncbi:MAG: ATP-binding protein [Acidimicrobiia bacterium]|nr:ATP-binding protein [Acidimicrobiia bacterium]
MGLILLVVVAFVVAAAVESISTRTAVTNWTAEQAAVIEQVMQEAVDGVIADVEAVAAFVEEIGSDPGTFESFTNRIEGTDSAVGYGYLTEVSASEIYDFVDSQRAVHGDWYEIWGFPDDESSDDNLFFMDAAPTDLTSRDVFYPVQAFAVGNLIRAAVPDEPIGSELVLGLDAGFDPRWRSDITSAIARDGPSISQFISLRVGDLALDRVFFVSVPVEDDDGSKQGMVMAMMLEPLLVAELTTSALQQVEWEIIAEGDTPAFVDSEHAGIFPVALPGSTWSVAVAPTDEAFSDLQGLPWWAIASIAATLVGLAILAVWLLIDRRTEHNRAVQFRQIADDKDRFLASVSHELRTPLTVVSGLAHELTDQPESFGDEERVELMTMLMDQTEELAAIVEDLLVAARSDIGKVAIHYGEVDVGAEVDNAAQTSDLTVRRRGDPVPAYGDPQRVRQILRNLFTNAKRYGGPEVRVGFSEGTDWVEVTVSDNGDGVPREMRDVIFDPYRSAHRPSSDVRSVGLGLYISRNLAQAMGGDLEYVYDGEWSHFRLRLRPLPTGDRVSIGQTRGGSGAAPAVAVK